MKLAAICLFVTSLLALASAQPVVISGNTGYNADSPYNRLYNTKTVFTFRCNPQTKKAIARRAKELGVTPSRFMADLVEIYFKAIGQEASAT